MFIIVPLCTPEHSSVQLSEIGPIVSFHLQCEQSNATQAHRSVKRPEIKFLEMFDGAGIRNKACKSIHEWMVSVQPWRIIKRAMIH